MTIHEWMSQVVETDESYRVETNLQTKGLQFAGLPLVERGIQTATHAPLPEGCEVPLNGLIHFEGDPYAEIERLYGQFKRSIPSRSDWLDRGNFKAVSGDSLTYAELEENMPRQKARILLEGFILLAAAAGILTWSNPRHFFWRGNDPDLIIYRDWVA